MGSAFVLVKRDLRDRLYAEPRLRHDIIILHDEPFDNEDTHLLRVISERLPYGRNGMRAIKIEGDIACFQKDGDT